MTAGPRSPDSMSRAVPRRILAAVACVWLLALTVAFFLHRGDDAGQLSALLAHAFAALTRQPLAGTVGAAASVGGLLVAGLMVLAWFGLGDAVLRALRIRRMHGDPPPLAIAARCLYGSALWSMVWFTLGVAHLYRDEAALAALAVGLALAAFGWR